MFKVTLRIDMKKTILHILFSTFFKLVFMTLQWVLFKFYQDSLKKKIIFFINLFPVLFWFDVIESMIVINEGCPLILFFPSLIFMYVDLVSFSLVSLKNSKTTDLFVHVFLFCCEVVLFEVLSKVSSVKTDPFKVIHS